jgi:hypothetical protein
MENQLELYLNQLARWSAFVVWLKAQPTKDLAVLQAVQRDWLDELGQLDIRYRWRASGFLAEHLSSWDNPLLDEIMDLPDLPQVVPNPYSEKRWNDLGDSAFRGIMIYMSDVIPPFSNAKGSKALERADHWYDVLKYLDSRFRLKKFDSDKVWLCHEKTSAAREKESPSTDRLVKFLTQGFTAEERGFICERFQASAKSKERPKGLPIREMIKKLESGQIEGEAAINLLFEHPMLADYTYFEFALASRLMLYVQSLEGEQREVWEEKQLGICELILNNTWYGCWYSDYARIFTLSGILAQLALKKELFSTALSLTQTACRIKPFDLASQDSRARVLRGLGRTAEFVTVARWLQETMADFQPSIDLYEAIKNMDAPVESVADPHLPDLLAQAGQQKILESSYSDGWDRVRLAALQSLVQTTGMTLEEAVELSPKALDIDHGILKWSGDFTAKPQGPFGLGGYRIHDKTKLLFDAWLVLLASVTVSPTALFPQRGSGGCLRPMNVDGARWEIEEALTAPRREES